MEGGDDHGSGFFKRWRKAGGDRPLPGTVKAVQSHSRNGSPTPARSGEGLSSYSIFVPSTKQLTGSADTKESMSDAPLQSSASMPNATAQQTSQKSYHFNKIEKILNAENVDLNALRKLSWNGVPAKFRPMVWQLLLGYMPTNKGRRETAINRKRKEYFDSIPTYFDITDDERTSQEGETLRQILVDLPRTSPNTPFFHQAAIQKAMERILYIWSIRHPASGYVQGMNDLLTPILLVFMHPFVDDVLRCDVALLDDQTVLNVEADSYWCLTKLMDNIQDHYTFSQPGLQRMVLRLEDLIRRIDIDLHKHFEEQCVQYMQFAFRWMNCALLRELPLKAILRVWDTYLSEERTGFENFHVYVCAVLLKMYSENLRTMQFQDILLFLQDLPTSEWGEEEVEPILSQAYILSHLFDESPNHLS
mmetsp:Transcript_2701/g.4062  ORF Transcript_2701/g.4062 Transcript_2701/m.4062 type:complete len:419 (+) Transcript_2701:47-1303(+)|eukprot:CAMPEP_0185026622 /NCGR_PEP_ID=MMETSP1103-20130426/10966_1 /TAXON_ID=36769 /ORGANISM="Paraphysomonas bandaiensis, Strain Caron Lab Isolate" /LENGTH=418 /DNA_ID=CAMNT_0027560265 /DNA_START=33 /DNA_END=1289 /DNA_ORIENTATION=-